MLDEIRLDNDEGFVARGNQRVVEDEKFVEHIKFAQIAHLFAGHHSRTEVGAEAMEGHGAEQRDVGVAGFAGVELGELLDFGDVLLEFIREKLAGARRGVGEHPAEEGSLVQPARRLGAEPHAIELVGGAEPLIGEGDADVVRRLEHDSVFAGHLRVAGRVGTVGDRVDAV